MRRKLQRVTDCFALLNEPRRPWLDADSLKQKFLALSAEHHPDRVHQAGAERKAAAQARYAELNTAYNRLRDPKDRLLHFLELELGTRPAEVQRIPGELISFFNEVNQLCRSADAALAEKHRTQSPLLQVQLFGRTQESAEQLKTLQQRIKARREELLGEVQKLDHLWSTGSTGPERQPLLEGLQELYRILSYFNRWQAQLQERIVQLML